MNINMNSLLKKKQNPPPAWRHAADSCLPHLFHVFSALTCKGGADGSGPFLLLLAKVYFTPTLAPSLWMPPTPSPSCGRGVPCGSPHSCNTWEINQALCWQPLKQEDGELHEMSGIHDRYFHDWLKKRERDWRREAGKRGGCCFWRGVGVFILNALGLNEKFPHVLSIWKVSVSAADKRQPCPRK